MQTCVVSVTWWQNSHRIQYELDCLCVVFNTLLPLFRTKLTWLNIHQNLCRSSYCVDMAYFLFTHRTQIPLVMWQKHGVNNAGSAMAVMQDRYILKAEFSWIQLYDQWDTLSVLLGQSSVILVYPILSHFKSLSQRIYMLKMNQYEYLQWGNIEGLENKRLDFYWTPNNWIILSTLGNILSVHIPKGTSSHAVTFPILHSIANQSVCRAKIFSCALWLHMQVQQ